MGGIFGGGSSAPKQKATAEEKQLARLGVDKWNRYITQYAPLEEQQIANITRSTENLRAGRTNADIMQEATKTATQSIESGNITQGLSSLDALTGSLQAAQGTNRASAVVGNRDAVDQRALGSIETGVGMSGRSQQGLASTAYSANRKALAELNADSIRDNSRAAMLTSIAGTGVGAATGNYEQAQQRDRIDSLYRVPALQSFDTYGR